MQEISAIAAFRKKSAPAVVAVVGSKTSALSSLIPKALRRSRSAHPRRDKRVLPVDAHVFPTPSKRDVELRTTLSETGVVDPDMANIESNCHRWVRVGKGRWRQIRQQDTTLVAATTAPDQQGWRVEQPQRGSNSDTSTVVEPFRWKEKLGKEETAKRLIYNEAQWQRFIDSSLAKRSSVGSTPAEMTVEELA